MPFRFRLEPLLRHRRHLLEDAQSALGRAQLLHAEVEARLQAAQARLLEQWQLWEQQQRKGMTAAYYVSFGQYIKLLEQQIQALENECAAALAEVERQKELVVERDKAVKMLETLQENERSAYRTQKLRGEQKQLDEAAILKDFKDRLPPPTA